jgi:hypothetical protein
MSHRCEACKAGHRKCTHDLGKRILVIPDTQVKPGVPVDHFTRIGKYIAAKRPDYIVHLGDHWDMPSLSSYDVGKKCFEGRRYKNDIAAGNHAMQLLTQEYRGGTGYRPREIFLMGNHEERILRALELDPKLEGLMGYHDFALAGWEVHDFLRVVEVEGIKFSHYFTSGIYGRPVPSAAVLLREAMGSAVMGHTQKVDIAIHGKTGAMALMAGCAYQHDEDYLGPQGNNCRRQVVMLNEVKDGIFDPVFVSLRFLKNRY